MILLTFAYFFPLAGNSTKAYYWLLKESRNNLFRDLEKLRLKVEELFRDSGIIIIINLLHTSSLNNTTTKKKNYY